MAERRRCAFDGCTADAYGRRSWCNRHYFQKYRNGEMGIDRTRTGREWNHSHGYRRIGVPDDHPLAAGNRGKAIYTHRLVLFDQIGDGEHSCHWCGTTVAWERRHPDPGALVVDHLDSNPSNNRPSNLVPSCHGCNTRRGLLRRWHGAVAQG
jgi:hypothetical protein